MARQFYESVIKETSDVKELIELIRRRVCDHRVMYYALCRYFRPEVVVETGVFHGVSSAFILQALNDNNLGHLYSIDLPNVSYPLSKGEIVTEFLPNDKKTGYVIPLAIRDRWTIILGDAKQELPKILNSLPYVDIFVHDSEFTFSHEYMEYELACKKLRTGGMLVGNGVDVTRAFQKFCSDNKFEGIFTGGSGIAFKPNP
ncbi:MAG: class I SAM-dependent methyltransferase [Nitrososphaerales archaeon]